MPGCKEIFKKRKEETDFKVFESNHPSVSISCDPALCIEATGTLAQSTDLIQNIIGKVIASKFGSKLQQGKEILMSTRQSRKAEVSYKPNKMQHRST